MNITGRQLLENDVHHRARRNLEMSSGVTACLPILSSQLAAVNTLSVLLSEHIDEVIE